MLTRLHVRCYKALRDLYVTFEPFTVIVGPNGCGKSSVLEAISMIRGSVFGGPKPQFAEQELLSKNAGEQPPFLLELWARVRETDESIVREAWAKEKEKREKREKEPLSPDPQDLYEEFARGLPEESLRNPPELPIIDNEVRLRQTSLERRSAWYAPASRTPSGPQPRDGFFRNYFHSICRLELDAEAIARPSYLPEPEPKIGNDGAGLATVLSWLQGERDERFVKIEEQLCEFVPEVRRIRTRRVPIRTVESADIKVREDEDGTGIFKKRSYELEGIGHQVIIDYEHAEGVPAVHASEGTLLLLGLLTAIHTSNASVLLLDDIERGLHPKTQQQLVAYLKKMTQDGIQVIATSHSPYLLLHLDYDEVRAMTLAGAEGSKIGKLSEHPEFEQWKQEMSPSEFWTVFGESWLQERRADG